MNSLRSYFSAIHNSPVILWLIGLYATIELLLVLGGFGVFGVARFRSLAYEFGGFWPGILGEWKANYPFQSWMMFLTYGFLHSGIAHLVVNMITLGSLGPYVIERVGSWKFLIVYIVSIFGGAIGFALLSDTFRPMVGASGALFGLAGAILAWEYIDRFTLREKLTPVLRTVVMLVALNIVLYFAMNRLLAWEAHLGGFLAGWIAAVLVDPRGMETA
ncbi:MAG: rhomboid family intramembrane serine protease [Boseongicola sp.]|nr:MAG: rhomboid family intramembrane serine protease [Boseongicola sp.]